MLTVPLFVELLRTRPALLVHGAALAQAVLWTLVPGVLYSAPPEQLAIALAVGHEFQLGTDLGPPLAYWLAEVAYRAVGLPGVYLLAQLCVLVTYLAVFALGRSIVGGTHAALAVLLMVGVAVFAVPSPDFGPGVLATPLWALALLHFWRAVFERRRLYQWMALGVALGLLLLTTYAGLILFVLLVGFMLATERGRSRFFSFGPWIAGAIAVLIFVPHFIWLRRVGGVPSAGIAALDQNVRVWAWLIGTLIAGHAGLAIMVALSLGGSRTVAGRAPVLVRAPVDPAGRAFVYSFALVPAFALGLLALFTGRPEAFVGAPLVVLSGLAAVVAAGDAIRLVHRRLIGVTWAGLLLLPPLFAGLALAMLPWTLGTDLRVSQPADDIARFFAESFQRRTGRPLRIVTGDTRTASLIALAAPSRPSLYFDATPERSPWVKRQDIDEKGAIVVWLAADTRGLPPAAIRERFPDLVPEVPRAFERRFQGRLPLQRIGWAMIRPRGEATPPSAR